MRSTPVGVGPYVAAGCANVNNLVVANLNGSLKVYTNLSNVCAIVGNGNSEGVLTCCKSSNVSTYACIGVTCTVVLNVVTVGYIAAVGYPKEVFLNNLYVELANCTVTKANVIITSLKVCNTCCRNKA